MESTTTTFRFDRLQEEVVQCRACIRLVGWRERAAREKVRRFRNCEYWGRPVPALGRPDAALLVVGLAPAAHGGNRTGRMFTGDRSGDWLFEALHRFGFASQAESLGAGDGLELRNCMITAAARCAPPANKPSPDELRRCRRYLREELRLAGPLRAVVALGRVGFTAFVQAWGEVHDPVVPRPDFRHGGEVKLQNGALLISSFHPSQQNTQTGRLTRGMFHAVFQRAKAAVDAGI